MKEGANEQFTLLFLGAKVCAEPREVPLSSARQGVVRSLQSFNVVQLNRQTTLTSISATDTI
jgi:hypothetical protein